MAIRNEILTNIYNAIVTGGSGTTPQKNYLSYEMPTLTQLTDAPTLVSGFNSLIDPVGFDESNGTFTLTDATGGVYEFVIERGYLNYDNNPSTPPIQVSIDVRINSVSTFSRTAPISAATNNDEPASLSITTPIIVQLNPGDEAEVYVSAADGNVDPAATYITRLRIVGKKIFED